jgi:hypothetical protein
VRGGAAQAMIFEPRISVNTVRDRPGWRILDEPPQIGGASSAFGAAAAAAKGCRCAVLRCPGRVGEAPQECPVAEPEGK